MKNLHKYYPDDNSPKIKCGSKVLVDTIKKNHMNGVVFKRKIVLKFYSLIIFVSFVNFIFCNRRKDTNDKPNPSVTTSSVLKIIKYKKRTVNSRLHTAYYRGYIHDNLTFDMTVSNASNHVIYINYCEFYDSSINISYRDPITKTPGCADSCCFPLRLISYMDCNQKRLKLNPGDEYDFVLNLFFKEGKICSYAEKIITKMHVNISSDDDISYLIGCLPENKITEYRDNFGYINYYYPITISYWLQSGMYLELDSSLFFKY